MVFFSQPAIFSYRKASWNWLQDLISNSGPWFVTFQSQCFNHLLLLLKKMFFKSLNPLSLRIEGDLRSVMKLANIQVLNIQQAVNKQFLKDIKK